jgi:hypothetical protein
VTVFRHGSLEVPVDVLLLASDGARQMRRWDGRGAFTTFDYAGASPLASAVVDPEHKLLIEDHLFDNNASVNTSLLPRLQERLGYFAALALGGASP